MLTLVIHAPAYKSAPGTLHSFEDYFNTGKGIGYAIYQNDYGRLSQTKNCALVLLRKDRKKQRAEGHLVKLVATGEILNKNLQRYDVYFEKPKVIAYKPEKLNHYGVAVFHIRPQERRGI